MFKDIGGKIKTLATVVYWIGTVLSVMYGYVLMMEISFWPGLLTIVLGALGTRIGSFVLYGFGQLVENSDACAAMAKNANAPQPESQDTLSESSAEEASPLSTWTCDCGATNSDTLDYCLSCRRKRSEAEAVQILCPHCGAKNNSKNDICFACNKPLR